MLVRNRAPNGPLSRGAHVDQRVMMVYAHRDSDLLCAAASELRQNMVACAAGGHMYGAVRTESVACQLAPLGGSSSYAPCTCVHAVATIPAVGPALRSCDIRPIHS